MSPDEKTTRIIGVSPIRRAGSGPSGSDIPVRQFLLVDAASTFSRRIDRFLRGGNYKAPTRDLTALIDANAEHQSYGRRRAELAKSVRVLGPRRAAG